MRNLLVAALAAVVLFCPRESNAQTQGVVYGGVGNTAATGTLTTGSTDRVLTGLPGGSWATAVFIVKSAGTATATAQVSIDGGFNWLPAPYAKRLSTATANPTVQAISSTTLVTGDVWEVALPANNTHFALLCGATGTTSTVTVQGGAAYVPGNVTAVLYDVTSGTAAALDTATIDVSGWTQVLHDFSMNGGTPAFTVAEVDDGGTTLGALSSSITLAYSGGFGGGSTIGGIVTTNLAQPTAAITRPKRLRYQSAAIAAQTSRIRIVALR